MTSARHLRIPNEPHLALIRQARAQCGLPVVLARHPFDGLPGFGVPRLADMARREGEFRVVGRSSAPL